MLSIIVLLPLLAAIAVMLGAPARQTSIAAAGANLALGLWAAFSWKSGLWNFSVPVLEKPALNLSFGMQDGISAVMIVLSVLVTLAATLNARAPEGREKLYYSSILLIAAGAIGAFASTDLFFFFAFHELA
jgi:NADH-quinone oxidoreductase subunit M